MLRYDERFSLTSFVSPLFSFICLQPISELELRGALREFSFLLVAIVIGLNVAPTS